MNTPKTLDELDKSGCGVPNCGHDHSVLYFHARCHPNAGCFVRYEKVGRMFVLECAHCLAEVVRISCV